MFKINVNDQYLFETEKKNDTIYIDSEPIAVDRYQINENTFHVLHKHKSYRIQVIDINRAAKTCVIQVNSNKYSLTIQNQFDILLQQLGLDHLNTLKVTDLKAPMPGLVLRTMVEEGTQVSRGDNLLVLEAMKMENIIKALSNLTIKSLKVKAGDKVEKNQVLIIFE